MYLNNCAGALGRSSSQAAMVQNSLTIVNKTSKIQWNRNKTKHQKYFVNP